MIADSAENGLRCGHIHYTLYLLQALGLFAFISGAATQGSIANVRNTSINFASPAFSAAGWVIFLSFWVMVYQGLAILQLFLHVKLLYTNVPYINWSVFLLVVRTVM